MEYFPIFIDLKMKPVLVIGGGEVACRKVESLLKAHAAVTIIAPELAPYLSTLALEGKIKWVQDVYQPCYLNEQQWVQVWVTTDNPNVNHQVYQEAKTYNYLVNVVDDKPYCDFITPAMINRGDIQIAISSGGAAPVLIRNLRESIESILPQNLGLLADFANAQRDRIKRSRPDVDTRRRFWERFFADPNVQVASDEQSLEEAFQRYLAGKDDQTGSVTWITCHPDVELLPIKALRYMQRAELVFFTNTVAAGHFEMVRRDAEREEVLDERHLVEKLSSVRSDNVRVVILHTEDQSNWSQHRQAADLIIG